MNQFIELAKTFVTEWENIRPQMIIFAEQVYAMESKDRDPQIKNLLVLLQDLVNLFYHLSHEEMFSPIIQSHEQKIEQLVKMIENDIQAQNYFEFGELVQFELVPLLEEIWRGVKEIVQGDK